MSATKGQEGLSLLYRLMIGTLEVRNAVLGIGADIPPCIGWAASLLTRVSTDMCKGILAGEAVRVGGGPDPGELRELSTALESLWDEYARIGNRLEALREYSLDRSKGKLPVAGLDRQYLRSRLSEVVEHWDDDEAGAEALPTLRYLLLGTTSIGPFPASFLDDEIGRLSSEVPGAGGKRARAIAVKADGYLNGVWDVREAARACREAVGTAGAMAATAEPVVLRRQSMYAADIELLERFVHKVSTGIPNLKLIDDIDGRMDFLESQGGWGQETEASHPGACIDNLTRLVDDLLMEFESLPGVGRFWVARITERLA